MISKQLFERVFPSLDYEKFIKKPKPHQRNFLKLNEKTINLYERVIRKEQGNA